LAAFATLVIGFQVAAPARAEPLDVFVAASVAAAFEVIAEDLPELSIRISAAATSSLARQIENGAPAKLFISASALWMDYLNERGLINAASRRNVLSNRLVLVAPRDEDFELEIEPRMPLAARLAGGRLAIADPDHVPAGIYAREALRTLGIWSDVESHLAPMPDVVATLNLVVRGEVPAGIVYYSDAITAPSVRLVGKFPTSLHTPIRYEAALISPIDKGAQFLLEHLQTPAAEAVFLRFGFSLPEKREAQ
jgi:molybdate transport system substrate-binding protein